MTRTVLLVPRREDHGHRDALWTWCRARWEELLPDVPIFEGHHVDGSFNRSAAINSAARLADADGRWDVAIVIDSDVFCTIPNVRAAVERASEGYVTWAHRRWRGLSEDDTSRVIRDPDDFGPEPDRARDMDLLISKTNPISWSCCVAIPRQTFDDMGGFDERFKGWGFEDGAWAALVRALYRWDRIDGDVYHLWHPRSEERIVQGQPGTTASVDYIRNALLGRRYMIAAIRDHAAGDQPGEELLVPEMVAVHVANLTHDDARFLAFASARRMPEAQWRDWWPTLEELRDGARMSRVAEADVAVIVTSGGTADTWEARAGYLDATLASLNARLTGPVVQRVVYSDWPNEQREHVVNIAAEHGFYVVGKDHHGYTEMRRRLWSYIGRRVQARYVFVTEDDFVLAREVDLSTMVSVLERERHVTQLALLRGPYPSEADKGGVLGWPEATFTTRGTNGTSWREHRNFWTANPSLFRRSLVERAWPSGPSSERVFGDQLFRDQSLVSAFWGDSDQPWAEHLGAVRAGDGY